MVFPTSRDPSELPVTLGDLTLRLIWSFDTLMLVKMKKDEKMHAMIVLRRFQYSGLEDWDVIDVWCS